MTSRLTHHERLSLRWFFAVCALPFFLVFPYIHLVNNPNENVRTYMTMALVEQRSVEIDAVINRYGWVNDMARVPDPKKPSGVHFTSVKAPATSFLGVPVYAAFRLLAPHIGLVPANDTSSQEQKVAWFRSVTWALRIVTVQAPAFLFLIFFERHLRAFTSSLSLRLIAVVGVGLGTNYLAYSLMFVSHTWVAIAGYTAFALIEAEHRKFVGMTRRRRIARALWAGFFASFATALEYQSLPLTALVCVYGACVFFRPKQLVAFGVGALPPVASVLWFQWKAYGNPLTPGHKYVENQFFAAGHEKGLFGIQAPDLGVMKELLLSPEYGLFALSPFLALAFLSIPLGLLWKAADARRGSIVVAWLAVALPIIAISGYYLPRGGWTIGPRLLGGVSPFLGFLAVVALQRIGARSKARRAIVLGGSWGLATAGVVSVGAVSCLYNTLPPDSIARPFRQFVLPMVSAGYAPHHVGEWVGLPQRAVFHVALLGMALAACLALLAPGRLRRRGYGLLLSLPVGVAVLALGLIVPCSMTGVNAAAGEDTVRGFAASWEPSAIDLASELRKRAELPGASPCLYKRIAVAERRVFLTQQADADEIRAASCP